MPGFVPQVTCGTSSLTSIDDVLVVRRARVGGERAPVLDRALPRLALRRVLLAPSRYANVVSSGAIIPARAPHSIDMLQTVMRCSIESARIASPAYSTT